MDLLLKRKKAHRGQLARSQTQIAALREHPQSRLLVGSGSSTPTAIAGQKRHPYRKQDEQQQQDDHYEWDQDHQQSFERRRLVHLQEPLPLSHVAPGSVPVL
jgi:hypothetical protein